MPRIVCAMSGGVDSSVAAHLLKARGWEVIGLTMRLYDEGRRMGSPFRCCTPDDYADAKRVCAALGIKHYLLDLEKPFEEAVRRPFQESYLRGETPVPCIHCNKSLKFDALLKFARRLGAEKVATGHYARVADDPASGRRALLRGRDPKKDQSYFLFNLDQAQLAAAEFPLGELAKPEVRQIARSLGLETAEKPESMDICFVPPEGGYAKVVGELAPADASGPILDEAGRELGRHDGYFRYTVGQRRGLALAPRASDEKPKFVLKVIPETRAVVVGDESALLAAGLLADGIEWGALAPRAEPFRAEAFIRYGRAGHAATVTPRGGSFEVRFDAPAPAVAPGQALVLYDRDRVLAGGWIRQALRN